MSEREVIASASDAATTAATTIQPVLIGTAPEQYRIYLITDGLKSKYTKRDYGYAFAQFLKYGAKTQDLQVLLDYKPKVIEQMVIGYIEMLTEKGRAHKTIQLHSAAILHFFCVG